MNARAATAIKASPDFVISRVFDAPRDLVWKCFTESERVSKWWGPKGVSAVQSKIDLRPGGMHLYAMKPSEGPLMWGRQVYREIVAPERLVFINSFSDEEAGLTRHPMAPTWPIELLTIVTFEEQPGGKTKLTVRWSPISPTAEEQQTFDAGHDSMRQGWGGSFDKLDAYLAKR
jgi:uncharacterized protein YndB with AHSA1/START domain